MKITIAIIENRVRARIKMPDRNVVQIDVVVKNPLRYLQHILHKLSLEAIWY